MQCSDGTRLEMLVEDMSRNKWYFQVRVLHVLCSISICDLLNDFSSCHTTNVS
jgi:hypothetical protein